MRGDNCALDAVVALVDRLVSPGGCPWDASQTHQSLTTHLIEEAYEVVDVIDAGAVSGAALDDEHLSEELGDLLLQVVLHARLAQGRGAFDLDIVAEGLVAKLIRRHPHVFEVVDGGPAPDADAVARRWEQLKVDERPSRGPFEGIPTALPALARAAKVAGRLARMGGDVEAGLAALPVDGADAERAAVGRALFVLAAQAQELGIDAEAALREVTRAVEKGAASGHVPVDKPGAGDAARSH